MISRRAGLALTAALVAAGAWLVLRGEGGSAPPSPSALTFASVGGGGAAGREQLTLPPAASPVLAFMHVPGGSDGTAAGADPLLQPDLIRIFEQILLRFSEQSRARDRASLVAFGRQNLPLHVPAPWLARAQGLFERYVDYREALGASQPPDPKDPRALRKTFEARARLRAKFFAAEELAGLYSAEDRFDQFSLERTEIARNPDLTPTQRTQALAQAEQAWLTPEQRLDRQRFTAQDNITAYTEDMERRGLSDDQRYTERAQTLGPEIAQRLGALDRSERDWQSRLNQYVSATEEQRTPLLLSLFTEQERLRVAGALELREAQRKNSGVVK